jgi:hypothetical protein
MKFPQNATLKLPASDLQIILSKKSLNSKLHTHTQDKTRDTRERDSKTKEETLSPCRKTAAALREEIPGTSKMEALFL